MSYNYDFQGDLSKAQQEEIEAAKLIIDNFPQFRELKDTLHFNDDNRYDFSFTRENSTIITFEVKDDDYTFRSDNVAIETKCRGKKSGIMITEATYWVHKIRGTFYIFKTDKIKKKIEEKKYERFVDNAGDYGSYTNLYLFNQNKFIKWGKPLKEK